MTRKPPKILIISPDERLSEFDDPHRAALFMWGRSVKTWRIYRLVEDAPADFKELEKRLT